MRDLHYGQVCFKSVKTLGAPHSQLCKRPRPSAAAFSTAKNVELLWLYPIRILITFHSNVWHYGCLSRYPMYLSHSCALRDYIFSSYFKVKVDYIRYS